ncbi:MAG: ribosome silencing factor [Elusimicrobiaceae bacterium]|nr:ribosome silencing factor [Elusimicrobiaceae bacterium]
MNTKELVCLAARLADDKKAENIKVIDLGGLSSLCDYVLIMTATSKPHLEAVEEEISKKLKEIGIYKTNRDGADSLQWRVSDYGAFLVHIMTQDARDFYALDKIFSFGTELDFTKPVKKAPAKKTVAKKPAAQKTTKKTPAKKAAKKPAAKKKGSQTKTVKKSTKTTKKK